MFYKNKRARVKVNLFAAYQKQPDSNLFVFQSFLSLTIALIFFTQFGRWVLFKGEETDKLILFDFENWDLNYFHFCPYESYDQKSLIFVHFESTDSIGIFDSKVLKIFDKNGEHDWYLSKQLTLPSSTHRYGYCQIE